MSQETFPVATMFFAMRKAVRALATSRASLGVRLAAAHHAALGELDESPLGEECRERIAMVFASSVSQSTLHPGHFAGMDNSAQSTIAGKVWGMWEELQEDMRQCEDAPFIDV